MQSSSMNPMMEKRLDPIPMFLARESPVSLEGT
jgi:hypothetical protein